MGNWVGFGNFRSVSKLSILRIPGVNAVDRLTEVRHVILEQLYVLKTIEVEVLVLEQFPFIIVLVQLHLEKTVAELTGGKSLKWDGLVWTKDLDASNSAFAVQLDREMKCCRPDIERKGVDGLRLAQIKRFRRRLGKRHVTGAHRNNSNQNVPHVILTSIVALKWGYEKLPNPAASPASPTCTSALGILPYVQL
jgi:hypothetical protein